MTGKQSRCLKCMRLSSLTASLNNLLDWWTRPPYDYYNEWLSETCDALKKRLNIPFLLSLFAMLILNNPISRAALKEYAANTFGDMIKYVADVDKSLLAIDADLHADLERLLLENGSQQSALWGFNLYPDETGEDFIEYDSLINIRSWQGNPSRDVLDQEVREKIASIVRKFILE